MAREGVGDALPPVRAGRSEGPEPLGVPLGGKPGGVGPDGGVSEVGVSDVRVPVADAPSVRPPS
ncbi:hypothetical protein R6L23_37090, partial [Streptomyces sp. SR27]|uniref:hypothetical protein n=1 Tax=Streptomyces sp. SR27 TaxID=3076630 RepID=UPI00295B0D12